MDAVEPKAFRKATCHGDPAYNAVCLHAALFFACTLFAVLIVADAGVAAGVMANVKQIVNRASFTKVRMQVLLEPSGRSRIWFSHENSHCATPTFDLFGRIFSAFYLAQHDRF